MKIVIDTNVLVYAAKNKVDLLDLIRNSLGIVEIIIPDVVENELRAIGKTAPKKSNRLAANLAFDIAKDKKFTHIKIAGKGDDAILKWAAENKGAVLTNDLEFKFRLKEQGNKVYCLRQGKYVQEC